MTIVLYAVKDELIRIRNIVISSVKKSVTELTRYLGDHSTCMRLRMKLVRIRIIVISIAKNSVTELTRYSGDYNICMRLRLNQFELELS